MASRRKVVRAQPSPSGGGYFVWLRHPHQGGKALKASCQTTDANEAAVIAAHLTTFVNDPTRYPLTDEALQACATAFHQRAIEIWFGRPAPARTSSPWHVRKEAIYRSDPDARAEFDRLALLDQENPVLRTRVEELESEIARLRRKCGVHARVSLRLAVEAWAKEYPTGHARRTVREATKVVRDFLAWAEGRHGKKVFVGQIRRGDVEQWLSVVRSSRVTSASTSAQDDTRVTGGSGGAGAGAVAQDGTPHARARGDGDTAHLSSTAPEIKSDTNATKTPQAAELEPITRRKFKAYLSVFFRWARDRYDLAENPAREITVPGASRAMDDIQALKRYEDLTEIAGALRDWPYWRALWLTGVLAGPRWDELRNLRLQDVDLQSRDLSIRSAKTKRKRTAPIESTMLLPALRGHLERRARERQGEDVDLPLFGGPGDGSAPEAVRAAAATDLLFPSYVDEGTRARTKTEPGIWSDSSTFLRAWRQAIKRAWRQHSNGMDWKKAPEHWHFQPREWRHSAGSAMGHCGYSALLISQWLGNSEAVAKKHYIPRLDSNRWPLDYGGKA